MLLSIFDPIRESFTDMAQTQVGVFVILLMVAVAILLITAAFIPHWRNRLIRARFLEKDESPVSFLIWITCIVLFVKLFQAFIIQPFIVDGASMLPTFHNREFLLVDKLSYHFHEAKRGDVVIFKLYEANGSKYAGHYLIKRMLGLPGERIVIRDGVTTIYNDANQNGFVVDEPYVMNKDNAKNIDITLTSRQYFVMGDNRIESYDSRSWGPLSVDQIRGRVLIRVLPFTKFGTLPGSYSYTQ